MKDDPYPVFTALLTELGYPPVREFVFWPGRRFRWDYAWPDVKLALDVQGSVYTQGHHTRGKGYEDDCVKANEAAIRGWVVLRCTPKHIENGDAARWVLRALEVRRDGCRGVLSQVRRERD